MSSEKGEVIQIDAVRFVRRLPGSPEHVWAHLTECGRLADWYGDDGNIEPREGGAVWLMGGHIRGVVTRWQPCERLAYTWNVFDPGEARSGYPESYLVFELSPAGAEVVLTLTHLPIPEWVNAQTRMGWHTYLDLLAAVVAGRVPDAREVYMRRNAGVYGVDLDNLAR